MKNKKIKQATPPLPLTPDKENSVETETSSTMKSLSIGDQNCTAKLKCTAWRISKLMIMVVRNIVVCQKIHSVKTT